MSILNDLLREIALMDDSAGRPDPLNPQPGETWTGAFRDGTYPQARTVVGLLSDEEGEHVLFLVLGRGDRPDMVSLDKWCEWALYYDIEPIGGTTLAEGEAEMGDEQEKQIIDLQTQLDASRSIALRQGEGRIIAETKLGEVKDYLRNLLAAMAPECTPFPDALAPECTPFPDALGLCTQVDNAIAGLKVEKPLPRYKLKTSSDQCEVITESRRGDVGITLVTYRWLNLADGKARTVSADEFYKAFDPA